MPPANVQCPSRARSRPDLARAMSGGKFHNSPFWAAFSTVCSRGVAPFPQGMGSNIEHCGKGFRFRSVMGRRGDALRLVRADTAALHSGFGPKETRIGTVRQPAGEDAGPTGRGFRFRSGELFNVQTHALGKRGNATRTNGGKARQTKGNGGCCPGHRWGKSGSDQP